jgi:hypothetical protein
MTFRSFRWAFAGSSDSSMAVGSAFSSSSSESPSVTGVSGDGAGAGAVAGAVGAFIARRPSTHLARAVESFESGGASPESEENEVDDDDKEEEEEEELALPPSGTFTTFSTAGTDAAAAPSLSFFSARSLSFCAELPSLWLLILRQAAQTRPG